MAVRPPGGPRPPGLGPTSGPPAEPPPPAPPGLWQQQAAASASRPAPAADDGALERQREIFSTITGQVARLLEEARTDTENKVKMELKAIRDQMSVMEAGLDEMLVQLDALEPTTAEPTVDQDRINEVLSQLQDALTQEIQTLKEELHQTILAHNHNADLIKHHKDTIDQLRLRLARTQDGSVAKKVQAELDRVESLPVQTISQWKLEPLLERLQRLERQVLQASMLRGYPTMPPSMMPTPAAMNTGPLGIPGVGSAAGFMDTQAALLAGAFSKGKGKGCGKTGTSMAAFATAAVQAQAHAIAAAQVKAIYGGELDT